MDSVVVGSLVSRDREQELAQARELLRAWRRWNPEEKDDDIAGFTSAWTGWDISAVFTDPSEGHGELDHLGRVICAIAILGSYFHNAVGGSDHMLAKCLCTWDDFEIFRLFWLQHQDPPMATAHDFEQLARTMGLVGPIAPLRKDQLKGRAYDLDSHLHPIVGQNVPGTYDPRDLVGADLVVPFCLRNSC